MAFCHKCGNELTAEHVFCPYCGTKALDLSRPAAQPSSTPPQTPAAPAPASQPQNNTAAVPAKPITPTPQQTQTEPKPLDDLWGTAKQTQTVVKTTPTKKLNKVNVQGGRYVGKKWFIKLAYKTYTTDVEFFDERVVLSQGTGFASVGHQTPTAIDYASIYSVDAAKKFSIPNIIFAIVAAFMGLAMSQQSAGVMFGAFAVAAVVFFIGKTAMVTIKHSGGEYLVPTEFMSDAQQLRDKINMAKNQARG